MRSSGGGWTPSCHFCQRRHLHPFYGTRWVREPFSCALQQHGRSFLFRCCCCCCCCGCRRRCGDRPLQRMSRKILSSFRFVSDLDLELELELKFKSKQASKGKRPQQTHERRNEKTEPSKGSERQGCMQCNKLNANLIHWRNAK